jgi:hypothetical protein
MMGGRYEFVRLTPWWRDKVMRQLADAPPAAQIEAP